MMLLPVAATSVSAQFSVTVRVELDARQEPLGKLTAQIAEQRFNAFRRVANSATVFSDDSRERLAWEVVHGCKLMRRGL